MIVKTIYIGSVGGSSAELKQEIIKSIEKEYVVVHVNEQIEDVMLAGSTVAKAVLKDKQALGIVLCGNGFGIAKEASIHDDITVINCINKEQVVSGIKINNGNILALGARMITIDEGLQLVSTFLNEYK